MEDVEEWWIKAIIKKGDGKRALASLAMLVSWEIWKERNGQVFRNHFSTANFIIAKIREETTMWSRAGAKAICNIMPRE